MSEFLFDKVTHRRDVIIYNVNSKYRKLNKRRQKKLQLALMIETFKFCSGNGLVDRFIIPIGFLPIYNKSYSYLTEHQTIFYVRTNSIFKNRLIMKYFKK